MQLLATSMLMYKLIIELKWIASASVQASIIQTVLPLTLFTALPVVPSTHASHATYDCDADVFNTYKG